MTGEAEQGDNPGPSKEVISRAKEMGWCPKEEWRGKPDTWVDADTFVERGETLMPILKANNRRQAAEIHELRNQLGEAKTLIQANTETIEELKKFGTANLKKQAEQQAKDLKTAIVEARREGKIEEELELVDQLNETTKVLKETAESKPAAKPNEKKPSSEEPPPLSPAFLEWKKDNPWFDTDRRKANLAMAIAEEIRNDPQQAHLKDRAFLDAVTEEVNATLGQQSRPMTSKVEGGVSGGNGSEGGRGKGYSSLPSDAKAACERQAARLVGPGRAYAKIEDWRQAYAKKYFEE